MQYVLPNSQNFGCNLYTDSELFNTGQQVLNGCGGEFISDYSRNCSQWILLTFGCNTLFITGATHSAPIVFQVPEIRRLTGEEQKEVCKLATLTASLNFGFDREKARCYVSKQVVLDSDIAPGMYDVKGTAVMNFDGAIPTSVVNEKAVELISKAATATASGE
jgi:hypothetical protein